ncbi:DUF742 domain-containing protein [Micromonospora sp. RTGN7]|uniref:DUF742 domain-containing protein n=1 Tax=Micromonospora sp. RTGN7 TaxID=3016526 RepID=UPI0029FEEA77|nr:DUF742 domain-containing protein [Micromonospora sp. RTGN7]
MSSGVASAGPDPEPVVRIRPYLRASSPRRDDGAPGGVPGAPVDPEPVRPAGPRPFVLTAGRVAGADPAIGLETQVTARPQAGGRNAGSASLLASELQVIIALCGEPISVAEISARTQMHFGVTRVLVGDLRAAGHLDVHVGTSEDALDPDIILRVIDGLRAIS